MSVRRGLLMLTIAALLWGSSAHAQIVLSGGAAQVVKDSYIDQSKTTINYQTTYKGLDPQEVKTVVESALKAVTGPVTANDARVQKVEAQIGRQLRALQDLAKRIADLRDGQAELKKELASLNENQVGEKSEILASLKAAREAEAESNGEIRALILEDRVEQAKARLANAKQTSQRLQELRSRLIAERWRKVGVLGAGSVAIASSVVGVVFLLRAQSSWSEARAVCPNLQACPDDRGHRLSQSADTQATVATVGFSVAGATLALAGGLLLWPIDEPSDRRDVNVGLSFGDEGGTLVWRTRF